MATKIRKTHFVLTLLATWIDSFKRTMTDLGGAVSGTSGAGAAHTHAFTGTAPTAAAVDAATGTGYATVGQLVTTTGNFTVAENAYAGHWLLVQGEAPCLIVSHPGVTGAPLALIVFGLAPPTSGSDYRILRAPTPAGANANESTHTHGAGSFAAAGASSPVHYDRGEWTVSVANASDLTTSLALAKALVASVLPHLSDTLAHTAADDTNLPAETVQELVSSIVSLPTASDVANGLKAALNAHFVESGVHPSNDMARTISSPDATDQSSLNTLLNELKTDFNAHIADGVATPSWRMVD